MRILPKRICKKLYYMQLGGMFQKAAAKNFKAYRISLLRRVHEKHTKPVWDTKGVLLRTGVLSKTPFVWFQNGVSSDTATYTGHY